MSNFLIQKKYYRFKRYILFLFLFPLELLVAQKFKVDATTRILGIDAYAIVRLHETIINFNAIDDLEIKERFAITILNESGLNYATKYVPYDKRTKVNQFNAYLYDSYGNEIKKFKKKSRIDRSAVPGGTLYGDDRVLFYDIVPTKYPFTIYYEIEKQTSNTVFLPAWFPFPYSNLAVEKSTFEFNNSTDIKIRVKEKISDDFNVEKSNSDQYWRYTLTNHPRLVYEPYAPYPEDIAPNVYFAANEFELEGVQGKYENWEQFGQWMFNHLIKGRQQLTEEDKLKVAELTQNVSSKKEKIKLLYDYLQQKVRYISVQLGIGGWSPYSAEYVGRKSYGDCKALTNYMYSLLKEAGIQSNYTVVSAGRKTDFEETFPRMQGNHVILNVPLGNDTIWLENTDQKIPFDFLGDFTNDRNALSINQENAKIVKTQKFKPTQNQEIIIGKGSLTPKGKLNLSVSNQFKGLQYGNQYNTYFKESKEKINYVKDKYSDIKNVIIKSFDLENDKKNILFTIHAKIESEKYAKAISNNLILPLIPTGKITNSTKKDDTRKYPLVLREGFYDISDFSIQLPDNYSINESSEPISMENEFGKYYLSYEINNQNQLTIHREVLLTKGEFPPEKFNDFIEFKEQIEKYETKKILLSKQ